MKKIVDNTRKIFYLSLAMFPHPFITTEAELNEYIEAMEAFADIAEQLPDPPAKIWIDPELLDN